MAKRTSHRVPSSGATTRRWLEGRIASLEKTLESARAQLRADDDAAAARLAAMPRYEEAPPREGVPQYHEALRREIAYAVGDLEQMIRPLGDELSHLHYDLVAIREHLGIPNPGCGAIEEHTEP